MTLLAFRHAICSLNNQKMLCLWTEHEQSYLVFFDMVRYRKKNVVLLIVLIFGCGVIFVCSARSSADAEKNTSDKSGTELENSQSKSNSLFDDNPDYLKKTNNGPGTQELFFKFMLPDK